jgi:hypothetical protein
MFFVECVVDILVILLLVRTIDSFGIQDVDLIIESGKYHGKQALSTKRGMRTAMGSAQW